MQQLLKISRTIDLINEWIGKITYWFVLLMVLIGVWNVAGRYIGRWLGQNITSNVFIELQWYLFAIIFLLGAAYTLKHESHVRVDILYKNCSSRRKAWINLFGTVLFLIPFCLMMIYFSWPSILSSWQIMEMSPDPNGLPRYPIKSMILVSFALLILQGISEIIKNIAVLKNIQGEEF